MDHDVHWKYKIWTVNHWSLRNYKTKNPIISAEHNDKQLLHWHVWKRVCVVKAVSFLFPPSVCCCLWTDRAQINISPWSKVALCCPSFLFDHTKRYDAFVLRTSQDIFVQQELKSEPSLGSKWAMWFYCRTMCAHLLLYSFIKVQAYINPPFFPYMIICIYRKGVHLDF